MVKKIESNGKVIEHKAFQLHNITLVQIELVLRASLEETRLLCGMRTLRPAIGLSKRGGILEFLNSKARGSLCYYNKTTKIY